MAKKSNTQSKKSKRRATAGPRESNAVLSYAKLLADPCGAPLTKPEYGASDNGYLSRFRNSLSVTTGATGRGFVVWFPDHCTQYSVQTSGNGVAFLTDTPDVGPTGSMGNGAALNTPEGRFIDDPAKEWLGSSVCEDMRCIAACITFTYTGAQLEMAGRVGTIDGITQETLLNGSGTLPASPSLLLNASRTAVRTPLTPMELKWRPTEASKPFRGEVVKDQAFLASSSSTFISGDQELGGLGYGFAWEGLPVNATFVITRTKAVEWRPELASLVMDTVPRNIRQHNVTERSLAFLDTHVPGWQEKTRNAILGTGSAIIKRVMTTDIVPYLAGAGMGMLGI